MPVNPIASTLKKRNHEKGIIKPHANDVLSGRGKFVNNHEGNARFRAIVDNYKLDYVSCPKAEKPKYAKIVVNEIYNLKPPGRFLKQDATTKLWNTISLKKVIDKARQALREGAPDIIKGFSVFEQKSELLKDDTLEPCDSNPQINLGIVGVCTETYPSFTGHRKDTSIAKTEEHDDIKENIGVPSLEQEDSRDFLKSNLKYEHFRFNSNESNLDFSNSKTLCRRRRYANSRGNHHYLKEASEDQGQRFSLNTSSDFESFFSDLKSIRFSGLHDDSFNNIERPDGSFDKIKMSKSRETIYSITDLMQDIESLVYQDNDAFENDRNCESYEKFHPSRSFGSLCSINDLADDFDCLVCQVTSCPIRGRHTLGQCTVEL